jgi:hypothetical protein
MVSDPRPFKTDAHEKSISNTDYIPVIISDGSYSYGGNQGWFSNDKWLSMDYKIRNYGCGTVAVSDLFLYWAIKNPSYNTKETELAINNGRINKEDYLNYVRRMHKRYTRTSMWIGVLGPKLASAINSYNKRHDIKYKASWKWRLSYEDMLEIINEMLENDIPVIFSVGPNTPNLWGKKKVNMYIAERDDNDNSDDNGNRENLNYLHQYTGVKTVSGHYMTITEIINDYEYGRTMLCVSSWGKKYYIDYDEYRYYIDNYGGTYTSSLIYIR